jgi:hypothetical protein
MVLKRKMDPKIHAMPMESPNNAGIDIFFKPSPLTIDCGWTWHAAQN